MSDYTQELSELGDLLDNATAASLSGPEWQINMTICDLVNANHALCDDVARALQRKLQSGNPKVTQLALVVADTLVKNGAPAMHAQMASRSFLNEVAALTDGSMGVDVQNKALELIKQWADAFANTPLSSFQDTYRQLKIQGVVFPEIENEVPVFTPPSSASAHASSHAHASARDSDAPPPPKRTREEHIAKLRQDLEVVLDKISRMRNLRATGVESEELEDAVDFLRQCQPRMNTLIEGGIAGKLDERTLEECLNVNDQLIKALSECRQPLEAQADMINFDSPQRTHAKAPASGAGGISEAARAFERMDVNGLPGARKSSSPRRPPRSEDSGDVFV
ncbi:TPA: hypothetical protein N0F65_012439 [Lagenidium giganteum]|uniref:VHS domain-containing protein n=1 Tax=Lagenidium giganteum TaxID=4803 RepID=A0AAV2YDI3_9STRA|nr:TPA: hypothetical protein N0F65_012439 [Lagenidium giganteum]